MRHKREHLKAAKTGIAKQPCVWVVEESRKYLRGSKGWTNWQIRSISLKRRNAAIDMGHRLDIPNRKYRIRKYVRSES